MSENYFRRKTDLNIFGLKTKFADLIEIIYLSNINFTFHFNKWLNKQVHT